MLAWGFFLPELQLSSLRPYFGARSLFWGKNLEMILQQSSFLSALFHVVLSFSLLPEFLQL